MPGSQEQRLRVEYQAFLHRSGEGGHMSFETFVHAKDALEKSKLRHLEWLLDHPEVSPEAEASEFMYTGTVPAAERRPRSKYANWRRSVAK